MDSSELIPLVELCKFYHIEMQFATQLCDNELIEAIWVGDLQCIHINQLADFEQLLRLNQELEINVPGLEAIKHLLYRIRELQNEVNRLQSESGLRKPDAES